MAGASEALRTALLMGTQRLEGAFRGEALAGLESAARAMAVDVQLPFDEIQLRHDQQGRPVIALRLEGEDLWYDTLLPGCEVTLRVEGHMLVELHNR